MTGQLLITIDEAGIHYQASPDLPLLTLLGILDVVKAAIRDRQKEANT